MAVSLRFTLYEHLLTGHWTDKSSRFVRYLWMTELRTANFLTSCSKRFLHNSVRLYSDERNAGLLTGVTGFRLHLERILVIYARRDLTVWLSNFLFPMLTGYRCLVSECYIHNIILLSDEWYMDHRYHALLPLQGSANFRIVGRFSLQSLPVGGIRDWSTFSLACVTSSLRSS